MPVGPWLPITSPGWQAGTHRITPAIPPPNGARGAAAGQPGQIARHRCRTHAAALPAVRHNPMRGIGMLETHGAHGPFNFFVGVEWKRTAVAVTTVIHNFKKWCAPRAFGRSPCGPRNPGARTGVRLPCVPCAGGWRDTTFDGDGIQNSPSPLAASGTESLPFKDSSESQLIAPPMYCSNSTRACRRDGTESPL
jgi:hypothetical protein